MSLWTRLANVFRAAGLDRDIQEELQSHIAEAIEQGRDPSDARRAFGSLLRQGEQSRDIRIVAWLDSLRADAVFGWRQLMKRKVTSAAAILSLALAIGSCTSAFRLIDALLLRPLPITDPNRLYEISFERPGRDGLPASFDSCSYPMFRQWRAVAKDRAELIAASYTERADLTYASDQEMEKAFRQYVSGRMFGSFGLRSALGRLLTENDDLQPGAHPVAVISYDYWKRRFGEDRAVIGRTFRMEGRVFEIVGVAGEGFTGIEPGIVTDLFVPMMMKNASALHSANSFWLRTLVRPAVGTGMEPLRQMLQTAYQDFEKERQKGFVSFGKHTQDPTALLLESASAGVSGMQKDYRRSLVALGVLVALVLLIACANVANLMTAQAAARSRELALRVSIGAGRWRLAQLVLVESAWVGFLAAGIGGLFAWWSAPFVVGLINPSDNPARLVLPADWRVLGFGLALTLGVTFLFGLIPALRASGVKPSSALKGGEDPHSRRRLMNALIAVQVAFCFLVLFVAGLFATTFERLSRQSTGFDAERLLTLETVTARPQPGVFWNQVADHLQTVPGVESVALSGWPLMTGEMRNNNVSVDGARPSGVLAFFLAVSPGWMPAMKIPLLEGRDFRPNDVYPGTAIVNQTFAKRYFDGTNPVGKSFETVGPVGERTRFQIVGLARDAIYRSLREPMLPVAYVPFPSVDKTGASEAKWRGTFIVRTSGGDPLALASTLRREVSKARPEFRVSNIRTQEQWVLAQSVRERLLAMLALFFAVVALSLAGIGLYGVLDYSVLQRRREIGIRMAVGAQSAGIVRLVAVHAFSMVLLGAAIGLALGMASVRYIESLFYQVKATDLPMLTLPSCIILAAALLASVPAIVRAVRIDPAKMLRTE
jgi:putative ABC transport system permease protein